MRATARTRRGVTRADTGISAALLVLALAGCTARGDEPASVATSGVTQGGTSATRASTTCTAADPPQTAVPGTPDDTVDLLTWWEDGSQKAGLRKLVGVLSEQTGGTMSIRQDSPLGLGRTPPLLDYFASGGALDSYQLDVGQVGMRTLVAAGDACTLDGLYDDLGLAAVWPAGLRDRLAVDDHLDAMPAVADRTNLLWSNRMVLAAAGLDPDATYATVDDWIAAMRKVQAAGAVPLTLGYAWTQALLAETVLLADLGPERYDGLWDGTTDWAEGDVAHALGQVATIAAMSNDDRDQRDWTDDARSLAKGKAAFMVMGDWAREELARCSAVAGRDYTVAPVPGTSGTFAFITDSFVWAGSVRHPAATRAWFEAMASGDGQGAVALSHGGVPVRTDVDPAPFDPFFREQITDWRHDALVLSHSVDHQSPGEVETLLRDQVAAFVSGTTTAEEFAAAMTEGVAR